jgi:hypothetical protein
MSFDCRGTEHGSSHERRLGEHHFDKGVSVVGPQNDCWTAKEWLQGFLIVPDDSEVVETGKRKLSAGIEVSQGGNQTRRRSEIFKSHQQQHLVIAKTETVVLWSASIHSAPQKTNNRDRAQDIVRDKRK